MLVSQAKVVDDDDDAIVSSWLSISALQPLERCDMVLSQNVLCDENLF